MMRPSEPGRRQLIVAFTDGRDSTSIIDEQTAKTIARMSDAVVDIVVPVATTEEARQPPAGAAARLPGLADRRATTWSWGRTPRGPGPPPMPPPPVLAELVGPTAGQVIPLTSKESISGVFKATLEDFRASYVLQLRRAGGHRGRLARD